MGNIEKKKELDNFYYKVFNNHPLEFIFTPGRVNIIGEHIDYNGGKVFPMAISLGIFGAYSFNETKDVKAVSLGFNTTPICFNLDDLKNINDDYTKYIKGVIYILDKHGYKEVLNEGFNIALISTLPASSGLSSSAALELLILHILNDHYKLGISNLDLVLYAQEAERKYVGVNCGIMDQFAIGMAKSSDAILLDTNSIEYEYVEVKLKSKLYIINTNKPRNLSDSKYNERRSECEGALKKLQKHLNKDTLCSYKLDELNKYKDELTDIEYRRCRHVITENERVYQAIIALNNHDEYKLGSLLKASHESLKNDYEVSGVELDTIVDALNGSNLVLGARMTGAGFGGCAIALIKDVREEEISKLFKDVKDVYKDKTGLELSYYLALPSVITKL